MKIQYFSQNDIWPQGVGTTCAMKFCEKRKLWYQISWEAYQIINNFKPSIL